MRISRRSDPILESRLCSCLYPLVDLNLPHVNVIQHLDDEIIRTWTLHYQSEECPPHITLDDV